MNPEYREPRARVVQARRNGRPSPYLSIAAHRIRARPMIAVELAVPSGNVRTTSARLRLKHPETKKAAADFPCTFEGTSRWCFQTSRLIHSSAMHLQISPSPGRRHSQTSLRTFRLSSPANRPGYPTRRTRAFAVWSPAAGNKHPPDLRTLLPGPRTAVPRL